ncbi:MAG: hypothetical protein MJ001_01725 [Paludibacteraceae bacterium]|nr:hypothetical protein [Paludibacteraceae bacterium]
MTDQEWKDYCDDLSKAFQNREKTKIDNENKEYDAAVNMSMLDNCSRIFMLSRKMSVFFNSFYDDENFENLEKRRKVVKDSLEKFFEKEGSRMIVMVTEKPKTGDFLLGEEKLRELVDKLKLWIYKVPKDIAYGVPHFTIADQSAVRIEHNDEKKTATCVFHDDQMIACLKDSFETFKAYSTLISF